MAPIHRKAVLLEAALCPSGGDGQMNGPHRAPTTAIPTP